MSENAVALASRALQRGVGSLPAAADSHASEEQRVVAVSVCESLARQLEHLQIELVTGLLRDGVFAARRYRSPVQAAADLLGRDTAIARRRIRVAEDACPGRSLDGNVLPARLPATEAVLADGEIGLRHVEVIAEALRSPVARRLSPQVWAAAEEKLAEQAASYPPAELAVFAHDLISVLDQDGPGECEDEPEQVNELHLSMRTGKVKGRLDGLTREALATALDALCLPHGPEDERTAGQRRADALGEICARVLDSGQLPQCGGERPRLNVIIPLAELEQRAQTPSLDFGARLSPADLRMPACDARVVPVVLRGPGQPLDVGRARRTIPDGPRRAIAARDRGCAKPGCGPAASWCEIHHLEAWEKGGRPQGTTASCSAASTTGCCTANPAGRSTFATGSRRSFHRNGSIKPTLPGESLHTPPRSMDKARAAGEPSSHGRPANDRLGIADRPQPVRIVGQPVTFTDRTASKRSSSQSIPVGPKYLFRSICRFCDLTPAPRNRSILGDRSTALRIGWRRRSSRGSTVHRSA